MSSQVIAILHLAIELMLTLTIIVLQKQLVCIFMFTYNTVKLQIPHFSQKALNGLVKNEDLLS